METVTVAATALVLAGCLGLVAGLAAMTWLYRVILGTRPAHRQALRGIGKRLSGLLLAVAAVTVVAAVVLEARRAAAGLPTAATPELRRSLVLLALGGYLLLAQTLVGLTALTRRLPALSHRNGHSHDLGGALVSTASLTTAVLGLAAVAAVAYLHLSIGGAPG
ncbi:MAG: hypothetical protein GEV12_09180 [Micromonosporaceae bacterium]|nr:hypothetical protein [Micromonosporaceae bacterium]